MKRMTKITAIAALSSTALGGAAFAGNLADPVIEQPVYETPAPVVPASDWTGFYGGVNLGYADINGDGGIDGNGGTYGIHMGYDYDFGNYVLGAEVEYDKLDIDLDGGAQADDVARLKLRGGYDLGSTLVYATAGAARVSTSIGDDTGAFVGVGAAYKVNEDFTVGAELLGHRFDDIEGSGLDANATTLNLRGSYRF
ncbi:porin [Sulfitobacter sp. HNIBRBA3233]|uniref:outer membrane protein n=1 Tax=Sulfitobacter marinivivus TaxID=3158558 RepID=UPI0032DE3624